MNKLKKAIKELQTYLGRDAQGVRLLDQVSRLANDTRVEAGQLRGHCESQSEIIKRLKADLTSEKNRNTELANQVSKTESQARQLEATNARLSEQVNALEQSQEFTAPDIEVPSLARLRPEARKPLGGATSATEIKQLPPLVRDMHGYTAMFNAMRKDFRVAPAMLTAPSPSKTVAFQLETLISDYSGRSLITLGRFVASVALMFQPCTIEAETTFPDVNVQGRGYNEDCLRRFVTWFRPNVAIHYGVTPMSAKRTRGGYLL